MTKLEHTTYFVSFSALHRRKGDQSLGGVYIDAPTMDLLQERALAAFDTVHPDTWSTECVDVQATPVTPELPKGMKFDRFYTPKELDESGAFDKVTEHRGARH
jgi:hypothetical protein